MKTIEVCNLAKHFGKTKAVDGISFHVDEGEIFGFLGPNGAGKTTTIRCMLDFIRPTSGSILIKGNDTQKASLEVRKSVGYLSGEVRLNKKWTGQTHIDFFSKFAGKNNRTDELIKRLAFDPSVKAKALSSGNRQKLGLILAFMSNPDIIIFDEPTNGLDPFLQRTVYELLEEARENGATIFMSSHNLNEVERICDRVGIIKKGKIVTVESVLSLKEKRLYSIRAVFSKKVDPKVFQKDGVEIERELKHGYMLTVKGDVKPLMKHLSTLPLEDVEIMHSSLEDIFMEYYRK